jgi:hypothetical protein
MRHVLVWFCCQDNLRVPGSKVVIDPTFCFELCHQVEDDPCFVSPISRGLAREWLHCSCVDMEEKPSNWPGDSNLIENVPKELDEGYYAGF